jgi:HNH endonuclease
MTENKRIIKRMPSLTRVKELLHYDSETGIFTWLQRVGRSRVGHRAGCVRKNGYESINIDSSRWLSHRLAWFYVTGREPEYVVDHINGCSTDNRFANLRDVEERINFHNQLKPRANNTSGIKGVCIRGRKFYAQIMIGRARVYIGTFETAELAQQAYLAKKRELCVY